MVTDELTAASALLDRAGVPRFGSDDSEETASLAESNRQFAGMNAALGDRLAAQQEAEIAQVSAGIQAEQQRLQEVNEQVLLPLQVRVVMNEMLEQVERREESRQRTESLDQLRQGIQRLGEEVASTAPAAASGEEASADEALTDTDDAAAKLAEMLKTLQSMQPGQGAQGANGSTA